MLRLTIKLMHTSHGCFADLKIARENHRITRGLEAIGKTRFATIIRAARSVQNNTPAIKDVVRARKDVLEVCEESLAFCLQGLTHDTFIGYRPVLPIIHASLKIDI